MVKKIQLNISLDIMMMIKFDSEPVYGDNDKYIKTKIKLFGDEINTNLNMKYE